MYKRVPHGVSLIVFGWTWHNVRRQPKSISSLAWIMTYPLCLAGSISSSTQKSSTISLRHIRDYADQSRLSSADFDFWRSDFVFARGSNKAVAVNTMRCGRITGTGTLDRTHRGAPHYELVTSVLWLCIHMPLIDELVAPRQNAPYGRYRFL